MKILQMILLVLPVFGACMMATLIWKSLFVVLPQTEDRISARSMAPVMIRQLNPLKS